MHLYVAIVTAPSVAMETSPFGGLLKIGHGAEINVERQILQVMPEILLRCMLFFISQIVFVLLIIKKTKEA